MTSEDIRANAKAIIDNNIDDLDDAEIQDGFSSCDEKIQLVFLGTVFALAPSGKYYMPWACNNLTVCPECQGELSKVDTCDHCHGLGSREAYEDSVFYEYLNEYAEQHDCWIMSGEGDPCDLFLGRNVEEEGDDNG